MWSAAAIRRFPLVTGSRYGTMKVNCERKCPACRWLQHESYGAASSDTGRSANSFGGLTKLASKRRTARVRGGSIVLLGNPKLLTRPPSLMLPDLMALPKPVDE